MKIKIRMYKTYKKKYKLFNYNNIKKKRTNNNNTKHQKTTKQEHKHDFVALGIVGGIGQAFRYIIIISSSISSISSV